jgi:two-component sensor histidine kinase
MAFDLQGFTSLSRFTGTKPLARGHNVVRRLLADMTRSRYEMTTATKPLQKIADALSFAQVVVETVREPLLVLDGNLNIQLASGSFHRSFKITADETQEEGLFALDNGAWDIPGLRTLLDHVASGCGPIEGFEITNMFPRIGERTFLLHACKVPRDVSIDDIILLGFEDITERRTVEREKERLQKQKDELLLQKEMLLSEMDHRIVNSLQIIASILMLKVRGVVSEETREHLQDAHRRVMSVAAVQQHLNRYGEQDLVAIGPYLKKLCASLSQSMIGEGHPATLEVLADEGTVLSANAVNLGLIVTELVINALKYAFPDRSKAATVTVRYDVYGQDWKLSVSDNGVGQKEKTLPPSKHGLGTSLVRALAQQLKAQVLTSSGPTGMRVSIVHQTRNTAIQVLE